MDQEPALAKGNVDDDDEPTQAYRDDNTEEMSSEAVVKKDEEEEDEGETVSHIIRHPVWISYLNDERI